MQSHSHSDTDSDSDGQGGNPTHISIPAPSASKGELLEVRYDLSVSATFSLDLFQVLKTLQVQMQRLQDENKSIKEENKTLRAEKPKRKRRVDTQHELSVHEDTITIYARKYGMMMEMFPSSDLLNKKLPEAPTPFDSPDRYKTAATQDSAFLHELYHHFPESLHKIMESSYFSDMVCSLLLELPC
jgi:regulator of replication initiation timing